jgi:hypothetical protein
MVLKGKKGWGSATIPQSMALWYAGYFKLKEFGKQQIQERAFSQVPLSS